MQSKDAATSTIPKSFKPKIMDGVEIKFFKKDERGKFYLMRNPNTLEFLKIHEYAYEAIKMFDGTKTVGEIENALTKRGIEIETQKLVEFLSKEGFIEHQVQSRQRKSEEKWYSFQIKVATIKELYMKKIADFFSFVHTLPFKVFYTIFCVTGLTIFISNFPSFLAVLATMARIELPLYVFLTTLALFYVLRVFHELAHALVYSFYGGESAEMGIEFHFLMPLAYTDTPDVYWMKSRERIMVLAAGPLLNLFVAEIFVMITFLGITPTILWATTALFLHVDILLCLIPVMRTDGYYILQTSLKFPNLLEHGMSNIVKISNLIFRKISLTDYKNYLSDYSTRERKVLMAFTLVFPVVLLALIYFGVILALKAGVIAIISLTPQILTGTVSNIETYAIWLLYLTSIAFMSYGIVGSVIRLLKK